MPQYAGYQCTIKFHPEAKLRDFLDFYLFGFQSSQQISASISRRGGSNASKIKLDTLETQV